MRIFVLCDLEGAAGVVDFKTQTYPTGQFNEQARRLATLEVNALVDGAREAGATDVVLADGHGSGGLDIELLHPEARVLYGRPIPPSFGMDAGEFAAQFLYGHHAMDGTPNGVLCHSWSSRSIANCWLNDELIGEIGFYIAMAAERGLPTVFISGDQAAIDEARAYVPEIEGIVVKEGLSRTSALTVAPAKARELVREGASRAVSRIGQARTYQSDPPYVFITEYQEPASAKSRAARPGVEHLEKTKVAIKGDSLLEIAQKRSR